MTKLNVLDKTPFYYIDCKSGFYRVIYLYSNERAANVRKRKVFNLIKPAASFLS